MNAPPPPAGEPVTPVDGSSAPDARELADYLAGQDPQDLQAALWVVRRHDGLSSEEETELEVWLADHPARRARLDQLAGISGQLDDLPTAEVSALKAALPQAPAGRQPHPPERDPAPTLSQGPGAEPGQRQAPPSERLRHTGVRSAERRGWMAAWGRSVQLGAMTAFAAMLVGAGWLGWHAWHAWHEHATFQQRFATLRGQQLTAALPDGSTLRLDTATELEVVIDGHTREIRMAQGQAFFDIKPDRARPLRLTTGRWHITVLGTRFSVRHTQSGLNAGGMTVVVDDGRVRVEPMASRGDPGTMEESQSVELSAGQRLVVDPRARLAGVVVDADAGSDAWRDSRIVLNDALLGDALAEFERYADTNLVIRDSRVAQLRLNGSFDLRRASAFTEILPQALPVRLKSHPGGKTEVLPLD